MALRVEIDHEGPDPHLGQTKTVRGRDGALPCSSLKVEKELLSTGFHRREKSENAPISHHVLRRIIAFLIGIPFRGRKNPLVLFLKKLLFRNPEKLGKGQRRIDDIPHDLSPLI
jgi:hypothetical protein